MEIMIECTKPAYHLESLRYSICLLIGAFYEFAQTNAGAYPYGKGLARYFKENKF